MSILDIFKKEPLFIAGLHIDSDGNFHLIELKKINTSYFPIFTHVGVLEDFAQDGIFRKKSFIKEFKELRNNVTSDTLSFNSFTNKKLEQEIQSALKISGFSNVNIAAESNIDGIILPALSDFQQMSVFFSVGVITFTTTEHGLITETKTIPASEFRVSTVSKMTAKLFQKHIFLSGISPEMIDPVTGVFYQAGVKVHLQNVWENFLEFSDGVPALFPEESQEFIHVLSITIPDMRQWEFAPEDIPKNTDSLHNEQEVVVPDTIIYLPKPKKSKKQNTKQGLKKIHKIKAKKGKKNEKITAVSDIEKGLEYDLKKEKKIYLPKKVKKMFLPKPKKTGTWKKIKNILKSEI